MRKIKLEIKILIAFSSGLHFDLDPAFPRAIITMFRSHGWNLNNLSYKQYCHFAPTSPPHLLRSEQAAIKILSILKPIYFNQSVHKTHKWTATPYATTEGIFIP